MRLNNITNHENNFPKKHTASLTNSTPQTKISYKRDFRGHGLSQRYIQICIASDQVVVKTSYFKHG